MIMVFESFDLRQDDFVLVKNSNIMKKSFDVKSIKSLQGIKKIRSMGHCKLIRNEQGVIVLYEVNVFLGKVECKKPHRKGFLRFFRTFKFTAKLLRKIICKLFGL